jgi:ABC-type amino acid transport substrate-binding protein
LRIAAKILPPFFKWGEGLSLDPHGNEVPLHNPRLGYYWDGRVNVTLVGDHIPPPPSGLRRPTLTGFSREYLDLLFDTSRLANAAVGAPPPETALHNSYSGYDLILGASNSEMFQQVDWGRADAAHTAISVTTSRMAVRQFSKPFFPSSLSLMVRDDRDLSGSTLAFLQTFILTFLSQALPVFLGLVFLAANLVWSTEHFFPDTNRSLFAPTYWKGIWQAMEWASRKLIGDTTLKDVPFGRWAPRAAMVVTGLAVVLQSFLTGAITTGMQGVELHTAIRGLDDLGPKGVPVGTVSGTTSSTWLVEEGSRMGITNVHLYPDYASALGGLENSTVSALLYDFAPQRHAERQASISAARVAQPPPFVIVDADISRENYAIAFGANSSSAAHHALNLAIVAVEGTPKYDELYARFFSPVDESTASVAASFLAFDISWVAAMWGGGTILALMVLIFVVYRVRLAFRLGGCRRDPAGTRPRSMGSRARETLSRTQTFIRTFRGRGHNFDKRIQELEERAADEDRYLNDPQALRQTMLYSRDTLKKLMGLLDIMEGLRHHFAQGSAREFDLSATTGELSSPVDVGADPRGISLREIGLGLDGNPPSPPPIVASSDGGVIRHTETSFSVHVPSRSLSVGGGIGDRAHPSRHSAFSPPSPNSSTSSGETISGVSARTPGGSVAIMRSPREAEAARSIGTI